MEENESLGYVPLSAVKAMVEKIEQTYEGEGEPQLSFEFMIGSFFPTVLDNIHNALNQEHTYGYMEGLKAKGEDNECK